MAKGDYSLKGRIGGAAPPDRPGIEVEVVRITGVESRHFYLVGEMPWGAYFHWTGVSVGCRKPEQCGYCDRAVPRKWRAYLHALEQIGLSHREVILELTHTATVMLDVQLCGQPHRGTIVNIKKTKGGKHGRFVIEVIARRADKATLPDERDPSVTLEKLWKMNERRGGPDAVV